MPDKMHLEGGPKIGPLLAGSEEESFGQSQLTCLGFPKLRLVPVGPLRETGRFLLRNWGQFLLHSTVTDNRFLLLPILVLAPACSKFLAKVLEVWKPLEAPFVAGPS